MTLGDFLYGAARAVLALAALALIATLVVVWLVGAILSGFARIIAR